MSRRAVFMLGDSVSVHYGPHLAAMLGEGFDYDRKGGARLRQEQTPEASEAANGGDSSAVLDYLLEEVRHGSKYDILLLNCGLHDIRVDRATGRYQVEVEAYTGNLERIFPAAQAMAHAVLWVSSTPVHDAVHNGRGIGCLRYSSDLVQYNKIARDCAARHGVPVIDLYAFTAGLGGGVYCDHVHYKPEVRALQGAFLAGYLQRFLQDNIVEIP